MHSTIFLTALIAATTFSAAADAATPYFFDFNGGTDAGLTRVSSLSAYGAGASYTFPNGGYRIQAPVSPSVATLGASRGSAYITDSTLANFRASVDLSDVARGQVGIFARGRTPGFATTKAYFFRYNPFSDTFPGQSSIALDRIDNEQLVESAPFVPFPRDLNAAYKLVFSGVDRLLTGEIYNVQDLSTPLASISWIDNSQEAYTGPGLVGVAAVDLGNTVGAGATFDNLSVVPEPTLAAVATVIAIGVLTRRRRA